MNGQLVCQNCTVCQLLGSMYAFELCRLDTDTVCARCLVCDDQHVTLQACNETHNTVCQPKSASTVAAATLAPAAMGGVAAAGVVFLIVVVLLVLLAIRSRKTRKSMTLSQNARDNSISMYVNPLATRAIYTALGTGSNVMPPLETMYHHLEVTSSDRHTRQGLIQPVYSILAADSHVAGPVEAKYDRLGSGANTATRQGETSLLTGCVVGTIDKGAAAQPDYAVPMATDVSGSEDFNHCGSQAMYSGPLNYAVPMEKTDGDISMYEAAAASFASGAPAAMYSIPGAIETENEANLAAYESLSLQAKTAVVYEFVDEDASSQTSTEHPVRYEQHFD